MSAAATAKSTATSTRAGAERGRWFVLGIVLSAVFMQLLDTTITTVAVPSIQTDLGASFGSMQLVLAGYSLAFASVLVTGGRLGDVLGRRRMFLIGMVGFTTASALCGAAPGPLTLVLARILQGLCSGLMFPQVLAIISSTFEEKAKPKALALYGATIGLATITGPVLGGALIKLDLFGSGWRSIFYVNVPIGIAALILGSRKLDETKAPAADRVDLVGAAIVTTGLFLLVLPLVIGREESWPTWSLAMLAASLPVLAAFAYYEFRLTARAGSSPLLRTTLFRNRSFSTGLLVNLIFFAGLPSFAFTLLLTLQIGFGYDAVSAGAVTLAFALTTAIGSARSASIVAKLGTWTLAVGTALLTIGMVGVIITLHIAGTGLHGYQLIPALVICGAGMGLFLAPVTGVILAGIKSSDAGSASGVLAAMQQVGAAVGIAVLGIIFFGLIGSNATHSSTGVEPRLRAELSAAGVPAGSAGQITNGFQVCFHDRATEKDPSATPASCTRIQQQAEQSPAPAAVKQAVLHAVTGDAVPAARKADFSRSLQQALAWQVGVFAISFGLVLTLPKVRVEHLEPAAG